MPDAFDQDFSTDELLNADLDILNGDSDELEDDGGEDGDLPASGRDGKTDSRTSGKRGKSDAKSGDGRRRDKSDSQDESDDDDQPEEDDEDLLGDEEDKEETEEDQDDNEPAGAFKTRPTYGQIKKEFPDLFKKFPSLKDAFFREGKYTELFPTVEDAEEAVEVVQNFDYLQQQIATGNAEQVLNILGNWHNGRYRDKFVMNFLPGLYKADRELYMETTLPVVKQALRAMAMDAQRSGNEDMMEAAQAVHQYYFKSKNLAEPMQRSKRGQQPDDDANDERKQLEEEKRRFFTERYQEVQTGIRNTCAKQISDHLDGIIDPKNRFRLSNFEKRAIRNTTLEFLSNALEGDRQHMSLMNSLWQRGAKAGFPMETRRRIVGAYLSKAKSVLPSIVKHVIAEARGGGKKRQRDDDSDTRIEAGDSRKRPSGGPPSPSRGKTPNAKDVDWSKTSDADFLNDRVTYKGGK